MEQRLDLQTCREHHAHLEDLLVQLQALEPANADVLIDGIARVRLLLLRHLDFEDNHLYPGLLASPDPHVVEMAERYKAEMGHLAPACVAFFERWSEPSAVHERFRVFAEEWTVVRGLLERRIAAEDSELYELAERAPLVIPSLSRDRHAPDPEDEKT